MGATVSCWDTLLSVWHLSSHFQNTSKIHLILWIKLLKYKWFMTVTLRLAKDTGSQLFSWMCLSENEWAQLVSSFCDLIHVLPSDLFYALTGHFYLHLKSYLQTIFNRRVSLRQNETFVFMYPVTYNKMVSLTVWLLCNAGDELRAKIKVLQSPIQSCHPNILTSRQLQQVCLAWDHQLCRCWRRAATCLGLEAKEHGFSGSLGFPW